QPGGDPVPVGGVPVRVVHRAGQHLGVAEGVGDAVGTERVEERAGVADEGPARAARLPDEAASPDPGPQPDGRTGRREPAARAVRGDGEYLLIVWPSDEERVGGYTGEYARLAAVGGDDAGAVAGPVEPLVALGGQLGPVPVDDRAGARALAQ